MSAIEKQYSANRRNARHSTRLVPCTGDNRPPYEGEKGSDCDTSRGSVTGPCFPGHDIVLVIRILRRFLQMTKMRRFPQLIPAAFVLIAAIGQPMFGGLSLVLTPGRVVTPVSNPNVAAAQSWRVEFQMHNWAPATTSTLDGSVWDLNGVGAVATILADGSMRIADKRDSVNGGSPCTLQLTGLSNVLIRVQRDATKMLFSCELWNYDGTKYQNSSVSILSFLTWPYSNGTFGSAYTTADLGFFRIFSSLVPTGSQPPVTASRGDLLNLAFDGSLVDSSGRGNSIVGAVASFAATPNQGPTAILQTVGAPYWTNWVSLRAGYPATLDGSKSFSLADSSAAVTYQWQQVSGPTRVHWRDSNGAATRTSQQPVIQGLVFGTYQFRLQVTDVAGNRATADLTVGAVATDNNHVVIYPDDRLYAILGPQIAYGYNPWEFVDYSQLKNEEFWGNQFAVNGGGPDWHGVMQAWDFEPDLSSYQGVPRSGTAYVSGSTVTGVDSNFADVFCGGNTAPGAPPTYPTSYIWIHVPLAGSAWQSYPRQVASCSGQLSLTLATKWEWPNPPTAPGYAWSTSGICQNCGNWANANNTGSNLNYYDGQGLGNYALYYRSGWNKPQQTAQFVADHWYRNGFLGSPRDFDLVSAMIRATIDTSPAPVYSPWPYLRNQLNGSGFTAGVPTPSCTPQNTTSNQIADPRENGSCLMYRAAQALLDPDPASAGAAQSYLANALTGTWSGQQKADGSWATNVAGGDTSRTLQMAQGSTTATLVRGANLPANYCGESSARVLNTGTVTVGSDHTTVTGSGVDFSAAGVAAGDIFVGTGTFEGAVRSFSAVVSSASGNTLRLSYPWRGDVPGALSFYRIYIGGGGGIQSTGYYTQYFIQTTSTGNLVFPLMQDSDNFYICSVTGGGTGLTLDKPYTSPTGSNPYRASYVVDLAGPGVQPFMMAFPALGARMAISALSKSNPAAAAGYQSVLSNAAKFLWSNAYDHTNGGMWYGYGYTNCLNLQGNLWPAFACSGNTLSQNEDYAVEPVSTFATQYLTTGAAADQANGDTLYNNAFATTGFATPPGFRTNPNAADLLNCCDQFTLTKYYGQVYALGQAGSWPAARQGGVQPAIPVTTSISFDMSGVPGAVSAQVIVTQPNGVKTTFSCSASPCQVAADARQGAHWYQIAYLGADSGVLRKSEPELLILQYLQ